LDEEGDVVAIHKRMPSEANQLIEEFMLLANRAVARRILESERPGIYRVHDAPDEEQWAKMAADLDALGHPGAPSTRAEVNRIVRGLGASPAAYAVQLSILRSFKRAMYAAECREHFGLAFQRYTHFTSPIRRYPDLLVHRILKAIEEQKPSPYTHADLEQMSLHCSQTERNSDEAEKDSIELKRIQYYQRQLWAGETGPFQGLIVRMVPKGLIVELQDTLQTGLVPFGAFTDDYYRVNTDRTQAVGRRHRTTWRVGQAVEVEVTRVDVARGLVDFRMANMPAPGRRSRRSTPRRARKGN
jgi:ribonuclease R